MSRVLGVIPARLASSRLPEKPLQPLLGIPLVLWVWRRARTVECIDRLIVATDSAEVVALCQDAGAEAMLTSARHPTGSDRAWEVVRRLGSDYGVVVNIQGDEPLVEPSAVHAAVSMVEGGFEAATCATAVRDEEEFRDPGVVKIVKTRRGRALYFSRAPIPHSDGRAVWQGGPPPACGCLRLQDRVARTLGRMAQVPARAAGEPGAAQGAGERRENRSRGGAGRCPRNRHPAGSGAYGAPPSRSGSRGS